MATSPGKVRLILSLEPEVKEMIKKDAKALYMNPCEYVTMVCMGVRRFTFPELAKYLAKKYEIHPPNTTTFGG